MEKAQASCKKNDDARIRKGPEVIQEDDYLYLRLELKNPKDHRHKLASVAEGPLQVTKVDDNKVVMKNTDQSVEIVSRSRVVLAPRLQTEKEEYKIHQPMKLGSTKAHLSLIHI